MSEQVEKRYSIKKSNLYPKLTLHLNNHKFSYVIKLLFSLSEKQ